MGVEQIADCLGFLVVEIAAGTIGVAWCRFADARLSGTQLPIWGVTGSSDYMHRNQRSNTGSNTGSNGGSSSGSGSACGNGFCEVGEDHSTCSMDCCETTETGACVAECGNGFCEEG